MRRQAFLQEMTESQRARLQWHWKFWARPNQLPPDWDWFVWLIIAGRGFGKTRSGAEAVIDRQAQGLAGRIALVGETDDDVRKVMVEGEAGILACAPPWNKPRWNPSTRTIYWQNGAIATTYSAEKPGRLRGPAHDLAWCDELAKWQRMLETWDNLLFGLRQSEDPRVVVTTTPKPVALLKELLKDKQNAITRGTTYENEANLPSKFFTKIISRYEGTRIGRQELLAEMLDDVQGALWQRARIDADRVRETPDLSRIVVAIDPAVSRNRTSSETGIVGGGLGVDGHGYMLGDESGRFTPDGWARLAIGLLDTLDGDRIVAEVNNGGDLVESTIRTVDSDVSYKSVHASRGKITRAEPVAALSEQHKIHHLGTFGILEDQLCSYTGEEASPDRLDAYVWCFTELMLGSRLAFA